MPTYYVDPDLGSDVFNNGTSTASPWRTLAQWVSRQQSGDTLLLIGQKPCVGTITVTSPNVTINSYGGGRGVVWGTNHCVNIGDPATNTTVLNLDLSPVVNVLGTTGVYAATNSGAYVTGPTVQNCTASGFRILSGVGGQGFFLSGRYLNAKYVNCVGSGNEYSGFGMSGWFPNDATNTNLLIQDCVFNGNYGSVNTIAWGVIGGNWCGATFLRVTADGNGVLSRAASCGGLVMFVSSFLTAQCCQFVGNRDKSAIDGQGCVFDQAQNCLIDSCYAADNDGFGLGIGPLDDPGYPFNHVNNTIRNCVTAGNARLTSGPVCEVYVTESIPSNTIVDGCAASVVRRQIDNILPSGIVANFVAGTNSKVLNNNQTLVGP